MPKFLKLGDYQPEDYTKADFMLYLCLRDQANGQRFTSVSQSIRSVKSSPNSFCTSWFELHISELESCRCPANDNELNTLITKIKSLWCENQYRASWEAFSKDDICTNAKFGPTLRAKIDAFIFAVTLLADNEFTLQNRDPDELSPKTKFLSILNSAAEPWQSKAMPEAIANAHAANMKLAHDPQLEKYCEIEFLQNSVIVCATVDPVPENAGFFLKVYHSPAFQHWLTQLVLLAAVLTAALVIMAFTVNATLLPLAVAGMVKGFSGMAAKAVLGSAIVIETGFAVALSASLHARFFSVRSNETSVPPAVGSMNPAKR